MSKKQETTSVQSLVKAFERHSGQPETFVYEGKTLDTRKVLDELVRIEERDAKD